jgi:hypothetical protein
MHRIMQPLLILKGLCLNSPVLETVPYLLTQTGSELNVYHFDGDCTSACGVPKCGEVCDIVQLALKLTKPKR